MLKRKSAALVLDRRARPRREDDWEPEPDLQPFSEERSQPCLTDFEESDNESSDDDDDGSGGSAAAHSEPSEGHDSDVDDATAPNLDLSSVSFGDLARAQASLPFPDRTSGRETNASVAERIKSSREGGSRGKTNSKPIKHQRSSRHAPLEQTSKKPVSRRREIIADLRRKPRDPRFDPLVGHGRLDQSKASKAYAFLEEYRDSEMADLRLQIKLTKNLETKEFLKRQLMSMKSQREAMRKKHEKDELLREHRRQEKELVAQGKKPFYLKKSEQEERLLTKRYGDMSKGQVDKAIARKRKRVAGKEKKELDSLQRVTDRH